MTVREIGKMLRSGQASCVEIVQEALRRIQERDRYRTFITLMAREALEEAAKRDKELASGIDRGPFHGVPIAHKDLFYTKGVRTTAGSLLFKDFIPEYDAMVVDKLRAGGAVSLGKLNQHELAYGTTSKNPHFGFVLNPRDLERVPGGSSGGSGAAVAAGFVPMALGTDTGGSIRIPASYCGVAGLKPTYGRVSRYGVLPLAFSLDHVGPLGETVEDCALAMAEIAGPDSRDPTSSQVPVPNFCGEAPARLDGLRIGVPTNFYFDHVAGDVSVSVYNAIEEMRRLGAGTVEVRVPDMLELNAAHQIVQGAEASSLYVSQRNGSQIGLDVWRLLEQGRLISGPDYVNAQRLRTVYRRQFDALWQSIDVLATPTTPIVAPRLEQDEVETNGYRESSRMAATRLVRAVNLLGEPALSLPCGRSVDGLPVGLQLVGKPFSDARLLGIGRTVERHLL
jgi:aspartyl-tRNA(Asn)/glutamyl-tRNA(Gln) amidotransferase subunit A